MLWFYFLYLVDVLKHTSHWDLKYNYSGYDERPCINNEISLSKIIFNHKKMDLLKYLQNINNSQQNKLDKIYNSHFFDLESNFIPNITKGIDLGLDW